MYALKRGQLLQQRVSDGAVCSGPNALRLSVTYVPIETLQLDPRSPRKHSKQQIREIETSIKAHGFVFPITVDRDGKIIAGHARYEAAKRLGFKEIPVIRLGHVNRHQARAIALADNRLTEKSTWDDKLLGEIFLELSAADLDFSLEATGFTMGEIDFRIENATASGETDPADEVPVPFQGPPVTKLGDLFLLGDRHRLLCGSALSPADYLQLMAGHQAQIAFSDPPYGCRVQGHVSGLGAATHREFVENSGEMSAAERQAFHTQSCKLLAENVADGAIVYICIDAPHLREVLTAGDTAFTELKTICTWVKHNAGMGSLYRSRSEFVVVFKYGTASHVNNILLGKHGRSRSTVWEYPGLNLFGHGGEEGNLLGVHPTVKPVRLVADALLDCSRRGDIVIDPFLGSGSTVIAAERTGRRCYGLELDPLYCDVIIRRWQAYSGERAVLSSDGRPFDEIAEEVAGARE